MWYMHVYILRTHYKYFVFLQRSRIFWHQLFVNICEQFGGSGGNTICIRDTCYLGAHEKIFNGANSMQEIPLHTTASLYLVQWRCVQQ